MKKAPPPPGARYKANHLWSATIIGDYTLPDQIMTAVAHAPGGWLSWREWAALRHDGWLVKYVIAGCIADGRLLADGEMVTLGRRRMP